MSNLRQSLLNNSWIELAARWILGLTFIYASSYKIISPADFARIVYGYALFPEIQINLIRGHEFDCGCFSAAQSKNPGASGMMLIRDLFYLVLGMLIVLFEGHRRCCYGRLISRRLF